MKLVIPKCLISLIGLLLFCQRVDAKFLKNRTKELNSVFSIGFDIGSNYLDVESINQELLRLDLMPIDPYTNNFTFELSQDFGFMKIYAPLTLINSYQSSQVIDGDLIFRSTSVRGFMYVFGVKQELISILKKRLALTAAIDINLASYTMLLSRSQITNTSIDSLITSSRTVQAYTEYLILQPAVELLYAVMRKKNQLEIGLRLGRFITVREDVWRNQHQITIQGLPAMGNRGTDNFALRFLYTFNIKKKENFQGSL